MIDTKLGLTVTPVNGPPHRWAPDEPEAKNILQGAKFTTSMPGGFGTLDGQLARRINITYPDLNLLDDVRLYGLGNETAWEGRMHAFPRTHGDSFAITPQAAGYYAHLADDPSFQEVYVDRDYSSWTDAPLERQIVQASVPEVLGVIDASADGGLVWNLPASALSSGTSTELFYQPPAGVKVAKFGYKGERNGAFTSFEAATLFASDLIDFNGTFESYALTLDNALHTQTLSTARRYAMLRARSTAGVTPGAGWQQRYTRLAAYGNHGLTLSPIVGEPDGLAADAVVADIVSRCGPRLTYSLGGSIESPTFVLPHLAFRDPTTGKDALDFLNAYYFWYIGVYDNRTFFFRSPDSGAWSTWYARLDEGITLSDEGVQIDTAYNGVYCTYTDAGTGRTMTVGPTASTADATSSSLEDTSSTNPVNAAGYSRRWARLDIGQPTTQAGAIAIGSAWLDWNSVPQHRGSVRITGTARHSTAGLKPAWKVRAGDRIIVEDSADLVPRKIISTTYDVETATVTADLDNTPHVLDAAMAQFGVVLEGVL